MALGAVDGTVEGVSVGSELIGSDVEVVDGTVVDEMVGSDEGCIVGKIDGVLVVVGCVDGHAVEPTDGMGLGKFVS